MWSAVNLTEKDAWKELERVKVNKAVKSAEIVAFRKTRRKIWTWTR